MLGAHRTLDDLLDAHRQALADLRTVLAGVDMGRWQTPTRLPGWSIADVAAHVVALEAAGLGRADPPHEPDWASLPHVQDDFGRLTEVPVDLRRSRSREELLAEYDEVVRARVENLRATLRAADQETANPFGTVMTAEKVLRMRTFDIWVHEQDIRAALGALGGLSGPPAEVACEFMVATLGFVWAKAVGAPRGSSVRVDVAGPGLLFSVVVTRGEDGRGRVGPFLTQTDQDSTCAIGMTWPEYVSLTCGRGDVDVARSVTVAGDRALAAELIDNLAVTP